MYLDELRAFEPENEEEAASLRLMLEFAERNPDALLRQNLTAHFTGSSMVFNPSRTKVLMAYHNIYHSWSWTGGHADGDGDLLAVALREAREETGLVRIAPISPALATIDVLPVPAHRKNGVWVPAHLHLSLAYCLWADDTQPLAVKPDENSAVGWLAIDELSRAVEEVAMLPVYERLIRRGLALR